MKHLWRNIPAHNCTPIIPKMKNTKKHKSKTFPSIGSVSNNNITKIRIPVEYSLSKLKTIQVKKMQLVLLGIRLIARSGLKTLTVLMADKLIFPTMFTYSKPLKNKISLFCYT